MINEQLKMVDINLNLPQSFFEEEVRSGHVVTRDFKELWAIQLDLLNEFDRVCKKYNLHYILDFGTLLGAVRHGGFIPWDDDLDVSMLREDYDILMDVGTMEFRHPYFLQNHYTDKGYDISVAKLRRSDTTFLMTENTRHKTRYNQGIFIDIFVFDNIPTNDPKVVSDVNLESYYAFLHMYQLLHRPALHDGYRLPFTLCRYLYYKLMYGSAEMEYRRLDAISRQFPYSDYVANIFYAATECRPREWFTDVVDASFEMLTCSIPRDYDKLLHAKYGNYMTPKKVNSEHSLVLFDTKRSYVDVLKLKME